jgi:hypothetical protein
MIKLLFITVICLTRLIASYPFYRIVCYTQDKEPIPLLFMIGASITTVNIGCYLDEPIHSIMSVDSDTIKSILHD